MFVFQPFYPFNPKTRTPEHRFINYTSKSRKSDLTSASINRKEEYGEGAFRHHAVTLKSDSGFRYLRFLNA